MYPGDDIFDGTFHLEIYKVLPIDDPHTVIRSPVGVEQGGVPIPFILPAISIKEGPIHSAKAAPNRRRRGKGKHCLGINIRPESKRTICSRPFIKRSYRRLAANGRKGTYGDEIFLVLDMPCRNLKDPGKGCGDLVNAEGLGGCFLRWFCQDNGTL